jgi:photosystem II stability/assembly factor-like uncharacterized protein
VPRLLVATDDGLAVFPSVGATPSIELASQAIGALTEYDGRIWAAVDHEAVWRWDTDGWSVLANLGDASPTCLAWTTTLLVGTSGAHLLREHNGELERVASFDDAEGRDDWYTPWGGPPDTRSITEWGEDVYVNIHVGGILRTSDGGASWTPTIDIDADVHQVTVTEEHLFAACASGLAQSVDRGATWSMRDDGLETSYARAVAICGDAVLLSASNGPRGGNAAVYRADLAGGPFARLTEPVDGNIDTHCLDALPDGSAAAYGTPDGRLFWSADQGATWEPAGAVDAAVRYLLVLP